jgi:adenine phosphoribosyltransferase
MNLDELRASIRNIADFPKAGITFRDITTLLADPRALHAALEEMVQPFRSEKIDYVVATESRGFIFGVPLALELNAGFVPVRKPGKLPGETLSRSYTLEYGKDSLEIHKDALPPGAKVLLVDDLLATGGTITATRQLVEEAGAQVVGCTFLIELTFLPGRQILGQMPVHSVIQYHDENP